MRILLAVLPVGLLMAQTPATPPPAKPAVAAPKPAAATPATAAPKPAAAKPAPPAKPVAPKAPESDDEKAVYALARESARSIGERTDVKPHSPWPLVVA